VSGRAGRTSATKMSISYNETILSITVINK